MEIRKDSMLYKDHVGYDYADSYDYVIADEKDQVGVAEIAGVFIQPGPAWFEGLMALRNKIVSVFGLKTTIEETTGNEGDRWEFGKQAGMFKVFGRAETEIILGEDDKHLDVRVSLFVEQNGCNRNEKKITVTTVVKFHNRLGRCYFFIIKPIHRIAIPFLLKRKFSQLNN